MRRSELAHHVLRAVVEVTELPAGYSLRLDGGRISPRELDELVRLERRCCPFLTLATRADPLAGGHVLDLTGAPGVKDFVAFQFGLPGTAPPG